MMKLKADDFGIANLNGCVLIALRVMFPVHLNPPFKVRRTSGFRHHNRLKLPKIKCNY